MDLLEYATPDGTQVRFATVEELRDAAAQAETDEIRDRLLAVATLREYLEARDGEIIEGLIGRLGVESLDDVTLVLEMTTQQAVEEELQKGLFFPSDRA